MSSHLPTRQSPVLAPWLCLSEIGTAGKSLLRAASIVCGEASRADGCQVGAARVPGSPPQIGQSVDSVILSLPLAGCVAPGKSFSFSGPSYSSGRKEV
jgi:hypothetical protein